MEEQKDQEKHRGGVLSSPRLVLLVVSVLLMLDVMLITVVEPILPGVLHGVTTLQPSLTWKNWIRSLFTPMKHHTNGNQEIYSQYAPMVGLILGLKPGVEVIGNILVGPLVDYIGHKIPLMIGAVLYAITSVLFALSPTVWCLIIARILQAVSSSLSTVAGLALLASVFTDDTKRAKASSIAFGGLSFGLIAGFPFGAVVCEFWGRATPFLILGSAALIDGCLRLIMKPRVEQQQQSNNFDLKILVELIKNRYILTVLLADYFLHFGLGVVFTTVPTFMQDTLHAHLWQMASVILLSTSVQFIIQYVVSSKTPAECRWKFLFGSLSVFGLAMVVYPLMAATQSIWFAMIPECILRVSMAMFTATAFPTLCFLTDHFHQSQYGAINGLYTATFNLGMCSGSFFGGQLIPIVGFQTAFYISAAILTASSALSITHNSLVTNRVYDSSTLQKSKELLVRRQSDFGSSSFASSSRPITM